MIGGYAGYMETPNRPPLTPRHRLTPTEKASETGPYKTATTYILVGLAPSPSGSVRVRETLLACARPARTMMFGWDV